MSKDALGNDIKIGNWYGQSTRTSGYSIVVVGKAESADNGKVRLIDIRRGSALYDGDIKQTSELKRNVVTFISNSVFPVEEEKAFCNV